jgi:large subunit ribosomal protein L6
MSRIGKKPITIPTGVTVKADGQTVSVKGPKGELKRVLRMPITVKVDGAVVHVNRPDDSKEAKSLHGLSRTLVQNMVDGVTKGYEKKLEIVGVGFKAEVAGSTLNLIIGYTHVIKFPIPAGVKITVDKNVNLAISGTDKEVIGQTAATIRAFREPDVYKGKGIKYEGEKLRKKVGKAGATA